MHLNVTQASFPEGVLEEQNNILSDDARAAEPLAPVDQLPFRQALLVHGKWKSERKQQLGLFQLLFLNKLPQAFS